MKTVMLEVSQGGHVKFTCLRLKSIYLRAEAYMPVEVVYGEGDSWGEKLGKMGYTVKETEVDLPLREDTFSELTFTCYDNGFATLYLFDGVGVMGNPWMVEYFCKEGLTFADAKEHWEDDIPEEDDEKVELTIPNNAMGALAVRLEQLHFDCLDHTLSLGDKIEVEERLEELRDTYALLAVGKTPLYLVDGLRGHVENDIRACERALAGLPEEQEEDRAYYEWVLAFDRQLLERIDELEQTPLPAPTVPGM